MSRSSTAMRKWLKDATPGEKRLLAKGARTSVTHLEHIAAGRRGVGAELAQRIAASSKHLGLSLIYPLDQQTLCATCARCPLVSRKK